MSANKKQARWKLKDQRAAVELQMKDHFDAYQGYVAVRRALQAKLAREESQEEPDENEILRLRTKLQETNNYIEQEKLNYNNLVDVFGELEEAGKVRNMKRTAWATVISSATLGTGSMILSHNDAIKGYINEKAQESGFARCIQKLMNWKS